MRAWLLLVVAAAAESEEQNLLQLVKGPPVKLIEDETLSWSTHRDLATVSFSAPLKLGNLELSFWGAVPSFDEKPVIALITRKTSELRSYVFQQEIYCTGPGQSHRAKLRYAFATFTMTFLCDWPQEEAQVGDYEVFLEHANGEAIGRVHASYTPNLLKSYGTVACVRNVWNDPSANVTGLGNLPQWLDYHLIRGVDHFIIYTTGDMAPALKTVYQPYIDAGVMSRVHYNMRAAKCWITGTSTAQQNLILNDCLYRTKGHARWVLPSLDVDEFLGLPYQGGVTKLFDSLKKREVNTTVHSLVLQKYRFARTHGGSLEISSTRRSKVPEPGQKYAFAPGLTHALGIHSVAQAWGRAAFADPKLVWVNHYRHPNEKELVHNETANISDESLLPQLPRLQHALEKRFGKDWAGFLDRMGHIVEPKKETCPVWSMKRSGYPVWNKGEASLLEEVGYLQDLEP